MIVSGLAGSPSRCCLWTPERGRKRLKCEQAAALCSFGKFIEKTELLCLRRSFWAGSLQRCIPKQTHLISCAMDASYGGDMTNEETGSAAFPRLNARDPYKRLGISREASEDEIQAARTFLINRYAGHRPSVDAIESAHDKIIMQKFYERRNPKIDVKKKVRAVTQHRVVQAVASRFQSPSRQFIIKPSVAFLVLGALTILFPTEEGPTLQVAISLVATLYFLYDRLKSRTRAFLYGAASFAFAWLFGTFLMVSVIPPLLKGSRSFEVMTSLITYVILWVSSSYLK